VSNRLEAKGDFRPDLEGLRGIAVLMVVAFHASPERVSGGFIGVDVFFVLSGFFITSLLKREYSKTGRISLIAFYGRRIRRILPAASLVASASAIAILLLVNSIRWPRLATDLLAVTFSFGNLRFAELATEYFAQTNAPSPYLHMWSLAVEEQFYLFWPVLFIALTWVFISAKKSVTNRSWIFVASITAVLAIASLTYSAYLTPINQPQAFFGLPSRAFELAVGAVIAICWSSDFKFTKSQGSVLGIGALFTLGVGFEVMGRGVDYPGLYGALPVAAGAMFILGHTGIVSQLLSVRPLRAVGRWSYSLYLWHWPIFAIASQVPAPSHALDWQVTSVLVVISIGLSALTYRFIESPIRTNIAMKNSRWKTFSLGLGLIAVPVLLAAGTYALIPVQKPGPIAYPKSSQEISAAVARASVSTGPVPKNLNPTLSNAEQMAEYPAVPPRTSGCLLLRDESRILPCEFGDLGASKNVWLIGDSHARQWFQAFERFAKRAHFKLIVHTHLGCTPLISSRAKLVELDRTPGCIEWIPKLNSALENADPDVVISATSDTLTKLDPVGYVAELNFLKMHSKSVIVLGDTPRSPLNIPECLATNLKSLQNCTFSSATPAGTTNYRIIHNSIHDLVIHEGIPYLDATNWFCYKGRICPAVIDNLLVYQDSNHITPQASRYFEPVVEATFSNYLRH
jgi:peptidoglycan/LPS O-acetylase OafA/YrhL